MTKPKRPAHAITPTDRGARDDWWITNPGYQPSPPARVVVNGVKCVEIDGGKLYDMARQGEPRK